MGKVDFWLAVLNGTIGDYLHRTRNGLATEMSLVDGGRPLPLTAAALRRAVPAPHPRVALFVHGLMCSEDVWTWPDGTSYPARLAADLGVTSLVLRYNTGLSIPDNGAALAALLVRLVELYPGPIEELVLVGYSMGGLVVRSACHVAALRGDAWLGKVRRCVYVGTPHLGAPLERAGRVLTRVLASIPDPYTRLVAQIGDLRSDGIKDLGDADLRHDDRARRSHGLSLRDPAHPVPLLPELTHYLVAGSLALDERLTALFGDALVPVHSGTAGRHGDAEFVDHVVFLPGIDHLALAHHPEVYVHLRRFCAEGVA